MGNPLEITVRLGDERNLPLLLKGQECSSFDLTENGDGTYSLHSQGGTLGSIRDEGKKPAADFLAEALNELGDLAFETDSIKRVRDRFREVADEWERYNGKGVTTPADAFVDDDA